MSSLLRDAVCAYIDRARSTLNVQEKTEMLRSINMLLPISMRVRIPSQITNEYVDLTLNKIEEEISGYSFAVVGDNRSENLHNSASQYSYYSDSIQDSRKEIHCECGNVIAYDDVQFNCNFPEYRVLECNNCSKTHQIIVDGKLLNVCGAV